MKVLYSQKTARAASLIRLMNTHLSIINRNRRTGKLWRRFYIMMMCAFILNMACKLSARTADLPSVLWFCSPPKRGYAELFSDGSSWPFTLQHLKVFTLQDFFVDTATDETLAKVFGFLEKHKIDLALEAFFLNPGPDGCGTNLEGYRPPDVLPRVLNKIRANGGRLRYIAMDEPLWYGHFAPGVAGQTRGCRLSLLDLANKVYRNVLLAKSIFPYVTIGEELPIPADQGDQRLPADYLTQVQDWIRLYRDTTGTSLGFLHYDAVWFAEKDEIPSEQTPYWASQLKRFNNLAKIDNIRSGIFFNGNPQSLSGKAWIDVALRRADYVERKLHLRFDDIVFQTWMVEPKLISPEYDRQALMSLVKRYIVDRGG